MKCKFILDACCGSRMFWFQKNQPNTIFQDIREYDKGYIDNRPNRELHPDIIGDFRKMDFKDKTFKLIVFDPPHLIGKGMGSRITRTYGELNKDTWREDIKKGFEECWRVLDDYGILIFKWNDSSVKRKEVLETIGKTPLFGHPNGSKIPTHWFCFMKIPEISEQLIATSLNSKGSQEANSLNMRYQETSEEVSQIANATSDNANIKLNLAFCLPTI